MNRNNKSVAIILKSKKVNEIDKYLFLISPTLGIINATAFGALKVNSRFQGKLEQFSLINTMLYTKKEDFWTIKEVTLEDKFDNLVLSIDKIFIANFFSEVILKCSTGNENEKIFNLLYNSINLLNCLDDSFNNRILNNFLIRYLFWTGFYIFDSVCSSCGKEIKEGNYFAVSKEDFSFVCSDCIKGEAYIVDFYLLNYINSIMHKTIKDSIYIPISKDRESHLKMILIEHLKFISNHNFKSLENFY